MGLHSPRLPDDPVVTVLRRHSREMWMASMMEAESTAHDGNEKQGNQEAANRGGNSSTGVAESRKSRRPGGAVKSGTCEHSEKVEKGDSMETKDFHASTVDSLSSIGDVDITKAPSFGSSASNQDDVVRALRSWSRGQWSLNAQDSITASAPSSSQDMPSSPVLDEDSVLDVIEEHVGSARVVKDLRRTAARPARTHRRN
ncbi:hypothetical protein TGVAND_311010 [Toxoplasma gondii VAND]|uniref:Uncharacterized protein n=1 Tax=Toxoplasma gondii VAND TaxID=933077 RepID=A0A086PPH5_TOXGO|nr:hypothetical protein TGVAND_311010 [Toxoplasma gondii VAND]